MNDDRHPDRSLATGPSDRRTARRQPRDERHPLTGVVG